MGVAPGQTDWIFPGHNNDTSRELSFNSANGVFRFCKIVLKATWALNDMRRKGRKAEAVMTTTLLLKNTMIVLIREKLLAPKELYT